MEYSEVVNINLNIVLTIWANDECITKISFGKVSSKLKESPLTTRASKQIKEYFNGDRSSFDLPLAPVGSEFQRKVWRKLQKIQIGEILSYKNIAISIGGVKYSRAIGMACNKNPLPILIPCHRVVGSKRTLTGYAGGIELKQKMLELEGISL